MTAGKVTGLALTAAALAAGCASQPGPQHPARRSPPLSGPPAAKVERPAGTLGVTNSYLVGTQHITFTEPPHVGPSGQRLGRRELLTVIRYPLARPATAGHPAPGRFPLLVFAPGFTQCDGPYARLLTAWASAGYVVAAVNFPRTDCRAGAAAYEPDLINQPADMSYVIGQLLALSARPRGLFSGLLNARQVAAVGQSDGGDTVAALAANTCCADPRLAAAAVLSGAEWPPMPGRYFARQAPPMLFVQGSADTVNPPWTSRQLYRAHSPQGRYYLDLFGATHTYPYEGHNPVEAMVARVTVAFFNRYVLGQADGVTVMERDGSVPGQAALVSGGRPPPR